MFKRALQEGCVFTKFGRYGWPHKRVLWLTPEVDALRWRAAGSAAGGALKQSELLAGTHCVRVAEVLDVAAYDPATPSAVLKANARHIVQPQACFSIFLGGSGGRVTLDLEADSVERMLLWVQALKCLVAFKGGL